MIAILMRVFAVSVFGFITASIASYLIGGAGKAERSEEDNAVPRAEIAALRQELTPLRSALASPTKVLESEARKEPDLPNET